MSQFYSDPERESETHALPNAEVFPGYEAECRSCGQSQPLFPDYYGLLYQDDAECSECGKRGLKVTDTKRKFYYWFCFPGCLPDSDPFGPFETEAEAIEDARENG